MKLLTKAIKNKFKKVGCQENVELENTIVVCKFFNPVGDGTWFATEFDPETEVFFGCVKMHGNTEWGYFSLAELKSVRLAFGCKIERDMYFDACKFSEI